MINKNTTQEELDALKSSAARIREAKRMLQDALYILREEQEKNLFDIFPETEFDDLTLENVIENLPTDEWMACVTYASFEKTYPTVDEAVAAAEKITVDAYRYGIPTVDVTTQKN